MRLVPVCERESESVPSGDCEGEADDDVEEVKLGWREVVGEVVRVPDTVVVMLRVGEPLGVEEPAAERVAAVELAEGDKVELPVRLMEAVVETEAGWLDVCDSDPGLCVEVVVRW